MKLFFRNLLFVLASSSLAGAEPVHSVLLYDVTNQKGVFTSPYLPNRVYIVYDPTTKNWGYSLTDGNGNLAVPAEKLLAGTVVSGNNLGRNAAEKFMLDVAGNWTTTQASTALALLIQEQTPLLKSVSSIEKQSPERNAPLRLPPATR